MTHFISVSHCNDLTEVDIIRSSELFSAHYGIWGDLHPKAGQSIRMGPQPMRRMLMFSDDCYIARCFEMGTLIGHCFVTVVPGKQICIVTQLVVHREFRQRNIATDLIKAIGKFIIARDHSMKNCAFCIVSSSPFAIQALEKAVGGQSVKYSSDKLQDIFKASKVPHLQLQSDDFFENTVNTHFFLNCAQIQDHIAKQSNWELGTLDDGHEFVRICEPCALC